MNAKTEARFWAKVEKTESCWLWTGAIQPTGYGYFATPDTRPGRRQRHAYAHRLAYELLRGPIPEGLTIDHLCRVRRCVNPDHLEPVTIQENIRRQLRTSSDHCRNGHLRTEQNTRHERGGVTCRECQNVAQRRRRARP